ncbi:MAG: dephospho-CoA kinase [Bacillota bacterium]
MIERNQPLVGLTGSIGSGKSTVSHRLAALGAHIVDADGISRELLAPNSPALDRVRAEFGPAVFDPQGNLDRKKLAGLVFEDDGARERLEGIIHPLVFKRMDERIAALRQDFPDGMIVLDIPLLFEAGLERSVDEILVVHAPEQARLERVMERDHCTREQALARMRTQVSDEEKCARADTVFYNDGDCDRLYAQVDRWYALRMGGMV